MPENLQEEEIKDGVNEMNEYQEQEEIPPSFEIKEIVKKESNETISLRGIYNEFGSTSLLSTKTYDHMAYKKSIIQKHCWCGQEVTSVGSYKQKEKSLSVCIASFPLLSVPLHDKRILRSEARSDASEKSSMATTVVNPEDMSQLKKDSKIYYQNIFTALYDGCKSLNSLNKDEYTKEIKNIAPLPNKGLYKKLLLNAISSVQIPSDSTECISPIVSMKIILRSVSYTHLTLPTKRIV